MSKQSRLDLNASLSKSSFLDAFSEGYFAEWLARNGKNLVYGVFAFIALLVLIYRLSSGHTINEENDFLQASNDFTAFTRMDKTTEPVKLDETFKRLTALMQKHPELHAAYDGTLAQTFLNRNQINEAEPLAQATLERTYSENLTFYADYATTTLMISENHFQDALFRAVALQQKMNELVMAPQQGERFFGDELFALNLLRIAMLQRQIGDQPAELKTLHEWKRYAGLDKGPVPKEINPQAFRLITQRLAIGSLSLPDYIAYREKELSNKK